MFSYLRIFILSFPLFNLINQSHRESNDYINETLYNCITSMQLIQNRNYIFNSTEAQTADLQCNEENYPICPNNL